MFPLFRHGVYIRLSLSSVSYFSGRRVGPSWCSHPQARAYAAIPPTSLKPTHSIYVSNCTDPYFNLTFEDWLFRFYPSNAPLLLLYRDVPCVVIGRNQNPWKEVNLAASETRGTPWIRRRSGGGTVYHDLGNTNYSIHVPRTTFDRTVTANVVVRAVRALGVDAYVNERNDICVAGEKMSDSPGFPSPDTYRSLVAHIYVSGSAYKIVNNRAYHHGTMLISTRLDTLGDLLRTNKDTMHTKGVASVRSPVRNLVQSSVPVTHDAFVRAVVKSFKEQYTIDEEPFFVDDTSQYLEDEYFKAGMSELRSWDWAYGQTPEFEYVISKTFQWGQLTSMIHSRHGVILSCALSSFCDGRMPASTVSGLYKLSQRLVGKRYGFVDDDDVLGGDDGEETREMEEVWSWLKQEMRV